MPTDRTRYPVRQPKNKMFFAIWLFGGPEDRGRELAAQLGDCAGFFVERHVAWGAQRRIQSLHVPAYLDAVVFLSTMMGHAECQAMRDKCKPVDVPVIFTTHKYTPIISALRARGIYQSPDRPITPELIEKFKEWKRSKEPKRADVELAVTLEPVVETPETTVVVEQRPPIQVPILSWEGPRELGILCTFRQIHEYMKAVGIKYLLANSTDIEVQLEDGSLKWQRIP